MQRFFATTLFLLVAIALVSCSAEDSARDQQRPERPVPAVEAVQARFGSLPLEQRLSGVVRAGNQVEIYPRIAAPIVEIYVDNGDEVNPGEPLIRLEDREYRERLVQARANLRIQQAQISQAEARLNELRSQLERQKTLAEREMISSAELEGVEAQVAGAEADLELALAQVEQAESTINEREEELTRTLIRAPIRGVVGGRAAEIGMQAVTANRLFTIGDVQNSKVLVSLTEGMFRNIRVGQTAHIYSETLGDSIISGEVNRISPFLQPGSFSTQAEIEIDNRHGLLLPGMFVTVDILYGESEQATLIPLSAVYRHPRTGVEGVYVAPGFGLEVEPVTDVDSGNPPPLSEPVRLEFRPVEIIAKGREAAGVAGISSGEWVITVGQSMMVGRDEPEARIRAASWDRILAMQSSDPQDLLDRIMERDITMMNRSSSTN